MAVHLLAVELRVAPDAREFIRSAISLWTWTARSWIVAPFGGRTGSRGSASSRAPSGKRGSSDPEQDLAQRLEARAVRAETGKNGRSAPIASFASVANVPSSSSLLFPRRGRVCDEERRGVGRARPHRGPHAGPAEEIVEERGGAGVVGRDVHDEEDAVGVVREVRKPRLGVPLGDGGRARAAPARPRLHHPRQRDARRERVVADLGVGVRERREERGLARVRRAEEHPLAGSLALDVPISARCPWPPCAGRRLRPRAWNLLAQVGEHLLRALVLREEGDHLAQGCELLPVIRRRLNLSSASWYSAVKFAVTPEDMVGDSCASRGPFDQDVAAPMDFFEWFKSPRMRRAAAITGTVLVLWAALGFFVLPAILRPSSSGRSARRCIAKRPSGASRSTRSRSPSR